MMDSFTSPTHTPGWLQGKLLVATPQLNGSCFDRAVIYICAHSNEGAMGLVVNHVIGHISCQDVLKQLDIEATDFFEDAAVQYGGPVESGKGFILHSNDYQQDATIPVQCGVSLTSNLGILEDLAIGRGPRESMLLLGYAGWGAEQLEKEIKENSWLITSCSDDLLFHIPPHHKWQAASRSLGVDMLHYVDTPGHA